MSVSPCNLSGSTEALDWLYMRCVVVRPRNGISCVIGEYCLNFCALSGFQEGTRYFILVCVVVLFVYAWLCFVLFFSANWSVFKPRSSNGCELKFCQVSLILIAHVVKHGGFKWVLPFYFQVFLHLNSKQNNMKKLAERVIGE